MTERQDPFVSVVEALVNASHDVTDPVDPLAQEWYDECAYLPDDSSGAITGIAKQAIQRVHVVRVNALAAQKHGHPTTLIGGRPHEVLYNPDADSVSIYDSCDQSEVILGYEELMDLYGWVRGQHHKVVKSAPCVVCLENLMPAVHMICRQCDEDAYHKALSPDKQARLRAEYRWRHEGH